jgi:hypothetical protein
VKESHGGTKSTSHKIIIIHILYSIKKKNVGFVTGPGRVINKRRAAQTKTERKVI